MAKLIPLSEAAQILGISEEQLVEMRSRNEIHGYRDGASWKFKETEIERIKSELASGGLSSHGDSGEDLIESPSDSDDDSEFELSLGGDDGSSGEIDSLLVQDEGRSGESGIIIGDELSVGGSDLKLADSDIELGFEGSSAIDPASDTNSNLNLDLEGSDVLNSSSINVPVDAEDDDDELLLAPMDKDDVGIGTEKRDPEGTGSGVSLALGEDDLDLGESAISAIDDLDSGELTLDAGDSGVSLVDPADSGIDIGMEPLDLSGSKVDAFDLAGDSGVEVDQDIASGLSAKGAGEDDFLLTPVEGELDDDDSGSQVIALDSDSIGSESALFGSGIDDGDFAAAEAGLEPIDDGGTMEVTSAGVPSAAAPVEAPYSVLNIISLAATAALVLVAGLMVTDLVRNMWSFDQPYAINSSIMDGIISLMGV
ncbi:helix-turn-helix domain-containing protein [Blastopirellula sp. JC732]|uniref:Helix-turn-helix domain-containing protein n=1 Tax=Blastopirellula sediminis TaxID=2894196 RepID=A0A9X1MTF0_9BACT|nr:helix-turn-helix domain-containing protein [Blastopirellula sediminis]MCC9604953.1 helix-turn-helix domain-containing protein [Blastopirellula sediminis]MCC9631747.1 helix-turn-helix domain-containing protein [Blastopirellula sediminis]